MRFFLMSLLLLFVGAHQFQKKLDDVRFDTSMKEKRYFLPNKTMFKMMSLGHDEAIADMLWIRTILISADFIEECNEQEAHWLHSMIQSILYLESNWETVYHYGSLMMELCDQIDKSDEILELAH